MVVVFLPASPSDAVELGSFIYFISEDLYEDICKPSPMHKEESYMEELRAAHLIRCRTETSLKV